MRRRILAWFHRDCWREWTHPVTGERVLFRPDPLCPDITPEPIGKSVIVPGGMVVQYRVKSGETYA